MRKAIRQRWSGEEVPRLSCGFAAQLQCITLILCWLSVSLLDLRVLDKCECETHCEVHQNCISFTGMATKRLNTLLLSVRVKLTNFYAGFDSFRFWKYSLLPAINYSQCGWVGLNAGVVIWFSVVLSSNPQSRLTNSQSVCILPVGIFNSVMFIWNVCFLCLSGMPVN